MFPADLDGRVLVGLDDDEDVAHGERVRGGSHDGLLLKAFEEAFDDGAFVAGGDEDGDALGVFAGREVEFLSTHHESGREKPDSSENYEDEADENCHF